MRPLIAACLVVCAGIAGTAYAGAPEGELFGYKLGAKYPVRIETRGEFMFLGQWVIRAERPQMPSDLKTVEIIATPKSFTIGNIYAKTELLDEAQAKALAAKYADLLSTLYEQQCQPVEKFLGESLKLRCNAYELTVNHFKPDKPNEKHSVHVGLSYANGTPEWKTVQNLFKTEFEQWDKAGKKFRLDQARKEQGLRGLQ